jgi:hypothetical protein
MGEQRAIGPLPTQQSNTEMTDILKPLISWEGWIFLESGHVEYTDGSILGLLSIGNSSVCQIQQNRYLPFLPEDEERLILRNVVSF